MIIDGHHDVLGYFIAVILQLIWTSMYVSLYRENRENDVLGYSIAVILQLI